MVRFDYLRLRTGMHLPPLEEEWTAATLHPRQTTFQAPGVIPTSIWKDFQTLVVQCTSSATWRISCKEPLLQSSAKGQVLVTPLHLQGPSTILRTRVRAPLYLRRWSCDDFASVKAGARRLFTSLARGSPLQDFRFLDDSEYWC